MKVICKYNDPDNLPDSISPDFDYGLELDKEYLVMGIMKNGKQLSYFMDENGKPGFYPCELFEVVDSRINAEWHFKSYSKDSEMYLYVQAVWGYSELCFDESHYEQIVDRDQEALNIYFNRKARIENNFDNLE